MNIGVVVASDIQLLREGIALALQRHAGMRVVGEASVRAAVLATCEQAEPDALVLDMAMPEALQVVRDVRANQPNTPTVALGIAEDELAVVECTEAGVAGYLARDGSSAELVEALRAGVRGEFRCSPRIAGVLARRVCALSRPGSRSDPSQLLTARELVVLELIAEGLCNKEIAVRLRIEVTTVKSHVHNIFEKLNVRRRGQAVALLREHYAPRRSLVDHNGSRHVGVLSRNLTQSIG